MFSNSDIDYLSDLDNDCFSVVAYCCSMEDLVSLSHVSQMAHTLVDDCENIWKRGCPPNVQPPSDTSWKAFVIEAARKGLIIPHQENKLTGYTVDKDFRWTIRVAGGLFTGAHVGNPRYIFTTRSKVRAYGFDKVLEVQDVCWLGINCRFPVKIPAGHYEGYIRISRSNRHRLRMNDPLVSFKTKQNGEVLFSRNVMDSEIYGLQRSCLLEIKIGDVEISSDLGADELIFFMRGGCPHWVGGIIIHDIGLRRVR